MMNGHKYHSKVDMDSQHKTPRKVRFTLPEHENSFVSFIKSRNSPAVQIKNKHQTLPPVPVADETIKVHGTCQYINGTLNFVQNDFESLTVECNGKNGQKVENKIVEPKHLRPCIKPPRKSREVKRTTVDSETNPVAKSLPLPISSLSLSKKFHYFIRSRSESRGRKKELPDRSRKSSTVYSHAAYYFPDNMKTESRLLNTARRKEKIILLQKTPDILTVPTLMGPPISLINTTIPIPVHVQLDVLPNISAMTLYDDSSDCESIPQISNKIQQLPHMNQMVNNDQNFQNFTQFFDRWRKLETAGNRKLLAMHTNEIGMNCDSFSADAKSSGKLSFHKKMPDGKSFSLLSTNYRKRIMDIEKTPLVTSLIRACKSGDRDELAQVIQNIRDSDGISKNDLNFVDKNGRTALSYICVTNLTPVLDFLLRLQGIDVNKADNEGNTPLHFAAEAGQSDMINMLITRSRSLVIDAKNVFGMTPLMKAAIQGRTDCAKRLMFANASPLERDTSRGLTPKEWARLCGRNFCADAMGEIMKKRLAAQRHPLLKNEVDNRSKIVDSRKDASLASKIRNIIPFYRPKLVSENALPDLVHNVKLEKGLVHNVKLEKDVVHSVKLEKDENPVPTVEITPANNHQLINKYKTLYASAATEKSVELQQAAPRVPLRRKSSNE